MTWKMSETIITKSDQLNAEDLLSGSRLIKVTDVRQVNNPQQPVSIHYEGDNGRPFKPCLTMRKLLQFAWGDDPRAYIGRMIEVYTDPDVKFGKESVGGVRISGLSDIPKTIRTMLSVTRGKRKEYSVSPIQPREIPPYPDDKFQKAFEAMKQYIIDGKMTPEQVINKCEQTGRLNDEQKAQIRQCKDAPADDDEPEFLD